MGSKDPHVRARADRMKHRGARPLFGSDRRSWGLEQANEIAQELSLKQENQDKRDR